MKYKYDVFISYSRKDYVEGNKIKPSNVISKLQKAFRQNGISYWFDKDGIYSGDKFGGVIIEAITKSKMLVFVSSESSNSSKWTPGEITEALEQNKKVIPLRIDDSKYCEEIRVRINYIDYVDYKKDPQTAIEGLIRSVNIEKERIKQIVLEQENEIKKETAIKEIKILVEEYKKTDFQQELVLKEIVNKSVFIGNRTRICPVCSNEENISKSFCSRCGWKFPSLYAIGGNDITVQPTPHLMLARANWQVSMSALDLKDENKSLNTENSELRSTIEEGNKEIQVLASKLSSREHELTISANTINNLQNQVSDLRKRVSKFTNDNQTRQYTEESFDQLMQECQTLAYKLSCKEHDVQTMTNTINHLNNEISTLKDTNRKLHAEYNTLKEQLIPPVIQRLINNMVLVEGGAFMMGNHIEKDKSSKEYLSHKVAVSTFFIGKFVVTQEEWYAVMGSSPSWFKGEKLPVEQVSWNDCQTFITKLNKITGKHFRLPTEAEWEYAARGGNYTKKHLYSGSSNIYNIAWFAGNSKDSTFRVGQKSANELGLYDMSGNVWEWCKDYFEVDYYSKSPSDNPKGPSTGTRGRVGRGGCFANDSDFCKVFIRSGFSQDKKSKHIGFRLAMSV